MIFWSNWETRFHIALREDYQYSKLQSYFLQEYWCVWKANLFINDKKSIEGSNKRESLQKDCQARRQTPNLLILKSLRVAKGCKCQYVCNLDFPSVISWVWLPWRDFTFREFSKRFSLLHHHNICVSVVYCFIYMVIDCCMFFIFYYVLIFVKHLFISSRCILEFCLYFHRWTTSSKRQ